MKKNIIQKCKNYTSLILSYLGSVMWYKCSGRVVQETMGNLLFGKLPCKLLCKLPFLQGKGYKACK